MKKITTKDINDYFNNQKRYYSFLRTCLEEKFKGISDDANGMIKTDGYGWTHLSTIEDSSKIREIAFKLMRRDEQIDIVVRNGFSIMKAFTNRKIFPKMIISGYENKFKKIDGRLDINDKRYLWNVNETLSITPTPHSEEKE